MATVIGGTNGNDSVSIFLGESTIYGYDGDDSVYASGDNNYADGGDGDDIYLSYNSTLDSGVDVVYGGNGNDYLVTGDGDDTVVGGDDHDYLNGGNGDDYLEGGDGSDLIIGDSGDDRIYGGDGNDILLGDNLEGYPDLTPDASNNDTILGGEGVNIILGGLGNDYLEGGSSTDLILGGSGSDLIIGGAGHDILLGDDFFGTGNNTIIGGSGTDLIFGGNGDDYIEGGDGFDILIGGYGSDTYAYFDGDAGADLIVGFDTEDDLLNLVNSGVSSDDIVALDLKKALSLLDAGGTDIPEEVEFIVEALDAIAEVYPEITQDDIEEFFGFVLEETGLGDVLDAVGTATIPFNVGEILGGTIDTISIPSELDAFIDELESVELSDYSDDAAALYAAGASSSDGDPDTIDHTLVFVGDQVILLAGVNVEDLSVDNIWV